MAYKAPSESEWSATTAKEAGALLRPLMAEVEALSGSPTGGTALPDGAATGQVLSWDGDSATWVNPPVALPTGGTAGQVLTKTSSGHAWQAPPTTTWDADSLAIARGFHEVLSATEPTQTSYTASNGQTYPVVWVKPITTTVPALPEEPFWDRADSTVTVADLVGVTYKITGYSKDGGATWTTTSIALAEGTSTNIETATGQTLPLLVEVQAFAEPGYTLPEGSAFTWTHDYPDPNATVVVTSDAFTGADGLIHTRMSDATLGGTAKQWADSKSAMKVAAGQMVHNGNQGEASIDVGAINMEVEFDLIRTDGQTGWIGTGNTIQIMAGSTGAWGNGFGFGQAGRVYENNVNRSDSNNPDNYIGPTPGVGSLGHYKFTVVGQTGTITVPNGNTYTVTLKTARTATQTKFMVMAWSSTTNVFGIDNLICRQVGY